MDRLCRVNTLNVYKLIKQFTLPPHCIVRLSTMIRPLVLFSLLCFVVFSNAGPIGGDVASNASSACPTKPILLVLTGGRTANLIWEYVTLYFTSKYLPSHTPYSMNETNEALKEIFENVTLPIIEDVPKHCDRLKSITDYTTWNTNTWKFVPLSSAKKNFENVTDNVILKYCSILLEPMVVHVKEIKEVLPYKDRLLREAQKSLWTIRLDYFSRTGVEQVTFVAVHIRRTDYIKYLPTKNQTAVGVEYYKFAMNYFRSKRAKFGDPVFVITTDDPQWAVEYLQSDDVFIATDQVSSPANDLVLLSSCNHSIYDYGTFGLWAALYTEGEVIAVWQGKNQQNRVFHNNPKWHFVIPETIKFLRDT